MKRVKVGWQFFRGLAILDAAFVRWTKSGWQRWTFGEHHDHKLFGRWLWINTYENTIFRGLFTSINPSYFDVNYRGTRCWPIPRWRGRISRSVQKRALNKSMEKAPMCVDECIPSIICKMTPGHWFQDISILQFLEDASSQSSWFRLDKKKISHCLWLILCGLSRRYTLWRK